MTKKRGERLRYAYGIFLSMLIVFVGVLFIRQVWSIYRSAPKKPYTVKSISKHFKEIAIPVWVLLGALFVEISLAFVCPQKETRPKAYIDCKSILERTKKRLPTDENSLAEIAATEKRGRTMRFVTYLLCGVVVVAALGVCLGVMHDFFYFPWIKKEFFAEHNGAVDRLVQCVAFAMFALTVASIGAGLLSLRYKAERDCYLEIIADAKNPEKRAAAEQAAKETAAEKRWKRVLNAVLFNRTADEVKHGKAIDKQIAKALKKKARADKAEEKAREKKAALCKEQKPQKERKRTAGKGKDAGVWILRAVIFAGAVALIVVGVGNGGMRDVLMKAINICTQCIGLG